MAVQSTNDEPTGPQLQPELIELFDVLVGAIFCAKDLGHRYVEVNPAFVRRTGRRSKRDVIGHRATDLFSSELAQRYEDQDRRVFATGQRLRDELEPILRSDGTLGWYVTTKVPTFGDDATLTGLVSVSRDLAMPSDEAVAVDSLGRVVDHVAENLGTPMKTVDLAKVGRCSPAQLDRRMRRVFGLSPTQYVLRERVGKAAQLLTTTGDPLANVAVACGFYDQAEFTRRFASLTGDTPAAFRRRTRV